MLVDPRARRTVRRAHDRSAVPGPSVAAVALLGQVRCLGELAHWEPAGVLLQEIGDAARGQAGLSSQYAVRARRWARAWSLLHRDLRKTYAAGTDPDHALAETIGAVLFCLLEGRPRPDGWQLGRVHQVHREVHGVDASTTVYPTTHG